MPWRDGGAQRRRPADWKPRAAHAVRDEASLGGDLFALELWSSERPKECIYRFDQVAAQEGWHYHAELTSSGFRNTRFRIVVDRSNAEAARRAADRAQRL